MKTWQTQEAKARLSELVRRAQSQPQGITFHGKSVAVVMSHETFDCLSQAQDSLVGFMQRSPLFGADDINLERDQVSARGL